MNTILRCLAGTPTWLAHCKEKVQKVLGILDQYRAKKKGDEAFEAALGLRLSILGQTWYEEKSIHTPVPPTQNH